MHVCLEEMSPAQYHGAIQKLRIAAVACRAHIMLLYTEQSQIYCMGGKGRRRFQTGESQHFSEYKGRLSDSWLVNEASEARSK